MGAATTRANSDFFQSTRDTNNNNALPTATLCGPSTSYYYDKSLTSASSVSREYYERETPERWRSRLWSGKAIIAYCRIIIRCQPLINRIPNYRITSNNNNVMKPTEAVQTIF